MRTRFAVSPSTAALLALLALVPLPTTAFATTALQTKRSALDDRPVVAPLAERRAGLQVDNVTLLDALKQLEARSGVPLAYSPSLLPASAVVSCRCTGLTVRAALEALLGRTALTFREMQEQIVVLPADPASSARETPRRSAAPNAAPATEEAAAPIVAITPPQQEPATVRGVVTTEAQAPIAGAVVSIPTLRLSAITNDAGEFRVVVPSERVAQRAESLHVTRIGYRPVTLRFDLRPGEVRVNVVMPLAAVSLDRLVVTGTLGNQQQRAQPAVVAVIDAADIVAKAPVLGVTELLAARTSGVSITGASGTTGAASRISIRGQASLNLSNRPLVFVDGVKISSGPRGAASSVGGQEIDGLNDINPDDIESIEIVKGPAAAALYGADASAGVIQILTKRGSAGSGSIRQRITTEYDDVDPNFTPNTNYYKCLAADIAATSTSALCKGQALNTIVTDNPLLREHAFRNGHTGTLNYSIQGGGQNFGYFGSFSGENDLGTLPNNSQVRRTGRVNFSWTASPTLSFEGTIGLARVKDELPIGDQGSFGYLIGAGFASPRTVRALADGTLVGGWLNAGQSVQSTSAIMNENTTSRATPAVTVRYSPRPWFTNQLVMGTDLVRQDRRTFYPRNDLNWYSVLQNTGSIAVDALDNTQYTVTYQGNLGHRFGTDDRFSSDFSFGTQWINNVSNSVSASGTGLITNTSNLVANAGANRVGSQGYGQNKQFGVFGQEMFGVGDRLYIKLAGRLDRASAFARNAQDIFLPSVGISYVPSSEGYWQHHMPSAISTFKLRAAYGETGRSPGATAALQTYVASPFVTDLGLLVTGGVAPGNPGNPDLKPERGTEFEGGFDMGLFNDRLGVEATYFAKISRDLIVTNPVPVSSGFSSSPNVNIGTLSNKGLELLVRATPVARRNFTWDMSLTANTLANKLVTVRNVAPINNRRCFKAGVEIAAWCVNRIRSVDTVTGVVTVSDTAEFLGGQLPKREGAFNTTVTLFRNVRLYALVDGKFNYRIYNFGREFQDRSSPNSRLGVLSREELGLSAYDFYRLHPTRVVSENGATLGLTQEDEDYFEDAGYVRLREVSVAFSFPASFSRLLRVAGSSVTVGGRNLGISTKYKGYDPEVLATDNADPQFRSDLFTVPPSRRLFARFTFQF